MAYTLNRSKMRTAFYVSIRRNSVMVPRFILIITTAVFTDAQPMKLMDMRWSEQFEPHYYKKDEAEITAGRESLDEQVFETQLTTAVGYSEQGMKDLDEVGDLVGGGDSEVLSLLRPYYSMVEMGANGNRQGIGTYMHVLPDEEYGDQPIYSVGGSMSGGIEPAGYKYGYMSRPFG